ncbi:hypothetical protein GPJ56_004370 [Histomonas meleagridis]|uniref:uncharacterized protein n=1 Tax=Histomonas meleagridis TaxID=135588 RepID=UPI003559A8D4|nr:hypothetical protein GPJ56_004370 [Histomonas meleagridis]KAH0799985.1 hypothetical protein GO595_007097 [Histomonas meleagridis]
MNVRHFVYEDSSSEEEASETIAHFKPQLEEESMQEQEEINDQSNAPSEINTTLFAGMQDYKDNDEELSLEFQSDGFPSNTLDKTKTESSTLKQNENDLENESFEIEFPDDLEDDDTEGWGA